MEKTIKSLLLLAQTFQPFLKTETLTAIKKPSTNIILKTNKIKFLLYLYNQKQTLMFLNKEQNMAKPHENSGIVNLIGVGTNIVGEVNSSGDIRVDGTLSGAINTKGKVVIGSTGMVEGNINASNADVSGELKGSVSVTELLVLKSTAKLDGDIVTNKLAIEPGASFTGSCSMGAVIKDINHVGKQEKQEKTA